jgi:hypothetical protein
MVFVILGFTQLQAQTLGSVNKAFDESYDASGKPFAKNPNSSVEGIEVLNQNWGKGNVKMTRNKSYDDAELQFNIATQQLFFKKEGTVFAFGDNVLSFTLTYDLNGKSHSVYFKNNYPAVGNQTNASFYQVMNEGKKLDLLKFLSKKKEERYEYNQPFKLVYTDESEWYFYYKLNSQVFLIKNSLIDIEKKLPGNWAELTAGFQPKNKKHLSEEEMLQLFRMLDK